MGDINLIDSWLLGNHIEQSMSKMHGTCSSIIHDPGTTSGPELNPDLWIGRRVLDHCARRKKKKKKKNNV